jgi:hypothetical protein
LITSCEKNRRLDCKPIRKRNARRCWKRWKDSKVRTGDENDEELLL